MTTRPSHAALVEEVAKARREIETLNTKLNLVAFEQIAATSPPLPTPPKEKGQ